MNCPLCGRAITLCRQWELWCQRAVAQSCPDDTVYCQSPTASGSWNPAAPLYSSFSLGSVCYRRPICGWALQWHLILCTWTRSEFLHWPLSTAQRNFLWWGMKCALIYRWRERNEDSSLTRYPFSTVILNLWVVTPLRSHDPVTGVACQIPWISDIYIIIHKSSKITVMNE